LDSSKKYNQAGREKGTEQRSKVKYAVVDNA